MSDLILKHIEGGVLTLTFNRPDKKNALTRDMYTVLSQALEQGATDDAVRVAVFQGRWTCSRQATISSIS